MLRVLLLLPLLLAACTQYGPMGFTGGVDSLQVAEDTYRITAKGNAWASADQIEDFVLLKASELAIARGYKGFVINAAADRSTAYSITTPGYATTTTSANAYRTGNVVTGQAMSTTTYTPPITRTGIKPGSTVIVTLVQSGGMDARMIYASLGPKHGAPPVPGVSPSAMFTAQPVAAPGTTPAAGDPQQRATADCQAQGLKEGEPGSPETRAFMDCYVPLWAKYRGQ